MTTPDATQLFYTDTGLDPDRTAAQVADALNGCDDGELYLQYGVSESFAFDDGRLKSASFDTVKGFGLRGVAGEMTAFAHANDLSHAAIARAADTIKVVRDGHGGTMAMPPMPTNARRYTDANPLAGVDFSAKVALMQQIDAAARAQIAWDRKGGAGRGTVLRAMADALGFEQHDPIAAFGQMQRRRTPGDPAADHGDVAVHRALQRGLRRWWRALRVVPRRVRSVVHRVDPMRLRWAT